VLLPVRAEADAPDLPGREIFAVRKRRIGDSGLWLQAERGCLKDLYRFHSMAVQDFAAHGVRYRQ